MCLNQVMSSLKVNSLVAVQTCLPTNRVVAGCEKMVQKVASSSTFLQQNLYMLRVLPAQDELVLQQVT